MTDPPAATGTVLDALRALGDPPADDVVAAFDEARRDGDPLWHAVAHEVAGDPLADDPGITAYLADEGALPAWCDEELVTRGQRFFRDNALSLNVAFFVACLPLSYCAWAGAKVLCRTGGLTSGSQRRIFESSILLDELAQEGELAPGGDAYLMLRRLRLLHAAVRRTILVHRYDAGAEGGVGDPWDTEAWGAPVNQLDLLGTTFIFALTAVDALRAGGQEVSRAEEEAWLHLWSVAGHLLGVGAVGPTVLPVDLHEARRWYAAVQERQCGSSPEGAALLRHLLAVGRDIVPAKRWDHLVDGLVAFHLGPTRAGWLGLEAPQGRALQVARRLWSLYPDPDDRPRGRSRFGRHRLEQWFLLALAERLRDEAERERSLRRASAHRRLLDDYERSMSWWTRRKDRRRTQR